MIAFDTDVFTEILSGNRRFVERAAAIPGGEQCIPVIVAEEIVRGRLNMIRRDFDRVPGLSVEYWG